MGWDPETALGVPDLCRELFDNAIESFLMGRCYGQKLHADPMRPSPSNSCIADCDRSGFAGQLELQLQLHAGKGANDTLNPAALQRQVL